MAMMPLPHIKREANEIIRLVVDRFKLLYAYGWWWVASRILVSAPEGA